MHIICITNTRVNMVCVHSYICANYVRARCGFLSIQLAHRIDIYTAYIQYVYKRNLLNTSKPHWSHLHFMTGGGGERVA